MKKPKNKVLNLIILVLFIVVTCFVGAYHEPWADEAQAWLIARDASVSEILFQVERYEGTPPIWHLILKFLISLGYRYEYLYLISVFFSSLGVGILLFKLDIPRSIKVLLPFTFFIFYEYTVKARSYCLVLPILALIASIYKNKDEKLILYNFLLALLSTISLHTAIISGILYLFEVYEIFKIGVNRKKVISVILLGIFYLLIIMCVIPTEDVIVAFSFSLSTVMPFILYLIILILKLANAFILNVDSSNLFFIVSIIFVVLLFSLVLYKNKNRKLFLFIFVAEYLFIVLIRASSHHIGLIWLTFLFSLYLVKDSIFEKSQKVVKIMITIICLVQIIWSIQTLVPELKYNYSSGKELAEYIKTLDYKNLKIYSSGYYSVAILPYFEENIFYNDRGGQNYYIWSINNRDWNIVSKSDTTYPEDELLDNPDMIILNDNINTENYQKLLEKARTLENYKETHFKGQAFYKKLSELNEKEGYYVFERIK